MIAALFVRTGGPYYGLEGVDPWDEERDARLYAGPPDLIWGPSKAGVRLDDGFHSAAERRAHMRKHGSPDQRLSKREREETPPAFRDALIAMARSARGPR